MFKQKFNSKYGAPCKIQTQTFIFMQAKRTDSIIDSA